jgi:hypothetical protein
VREIKSGAFSGCTSLSEITIPESVQEIKSYAFKNCTSLKQITISDNVKTIGERAFEGCSKLEKLVLPNSLEGVADYLCYNCTSLKSVVIPNSVKKIGEYAFWMCSALSSVVIPDSVDEMLPSLFYGCINLETITIGKSVKSIKTYLCLPKLKHIYSLAQEPPAFDKRIFVDDPVHSYEPNPVYFKNITLHVPKGCLSVYRGFLYWRDFYNIVEEDLLGIKTPVVSQQETDAPYYDLEGREVLQPEKGRIYIHGGRKVLVK